MKNVFSFSPRLLAMLSLGCLLLPGCTSVQLQSNKDESGLVKLKRLFVLVNHGEADKQPYSTDFAAALKATLTNEPVELEIVIASPLDLDTKMYQKRIDAFRPTAVLVVTATGGVISEYGGYPTLIYDASLMTPDMEKRLWRARINNSGGTALMTRRMREMAEKIVQQLRRDGFL